MDAQSNENTVLPLTSLSVGLLIRELLAADPLIAARATRIYPVVALSNATLPYICFRRANFDRQPAKAAGQGADSTAIEFLCYAKTYEEGIELAELVRNCLDHRQAVYTDSQGRTLRARSIDLVGSEEGYDDDAFAQSLVFTIRVNND